MSHVQNMPRRTPQILKRSRVVVEDEANNTWIQRMQMYSTKLLDSKYLSVTLVLKYLDSFICFYCVQ